MFRVHIRSITNKCPLPIVHVVHIVNNCSCSLFMPLTNRYLVVEVSIHIFWKVNLLFLNSTGMKNQVSLEGECYFLTFSWSASLFWMKDHTFFDFFFFKTCILTYCFDFWWLLRKLHHQNLMFRSVSDFYGIQSKMPCYDCLITI